MHFRADPIRAAVRKAHEAGQRAAIDRLLTAFGRTLAHQIAPELVTPITPRITKSDDREHGPASDPDLESDPHQALILAQIDHLIRCRETGTDPEPGDKRLHALWDDADELASVLMPHAHDPQQQKALAFAIYCKAAERAPKGGISLGGKNGSGGKFYAGGQWIPSSVIASASPEEKTELAERKDGTRPNPLNARDKKKAATAAKHGTRESLRKRVADVATDLMLHPHEATPDKYRDLAEALRGDHLSVNDLRALRLKLSASFGGGRRKEQMVAALLAHADAAGTELLNERAREVNANRKPESQSKSRKKDSESILQYVRDYGGIDPKSHELLTSYENMQRAYQDGIPMAAFKTGGRGLDQIARELEVNGHIHVPEDEHAGSYVLDLLREKAYSLHADLSKQYAKALDEYYVASGQASHAHSTAEIESSARSGAQTGRIEGENDALGEHGESPGRGPGAGATGSGSDPFDMSDDDFFKWFTEPAEAAPATASEQSNPSPVEQEVANRAAVAPEPASASPPTFPPNAPASPPSATAVADELRTAYNRLPPRQPGDGGPPIPPRKDVADLIGRAQAVSKPLAEGVSSFLNGGQQYSSRMYHTARELVDKHERDAKANAAPTTAPAPSGAIDLNDPHAFSAAVHDAAKNLTDYTGQPYRPDMSHAEAHKVPLADIYDSLTTSGKLPRGTTLEAFKDAVNAARTAGTVELARNDLPQVLSPADWERTKRSETAHPVLPSATAHYLTVSSEQPKPAFVPYTREKRPDRAKPFSPNVPPSAASDASEQAPLGEGNGTAAPATEPAATAPARAPFRSRTRFRTAADHAPTEAEFAAASQVGKPIEAASAEVASTPLSSLTESAPVSREHVYGMHNRPVGPATVPQGYTATGKHDAFKHGTVSYPNPLTDKQQADHELTPIRHESDIPGVARAVAEKMGDYVGTYLEPDNADAFNEQFSRPEIRRMMGHVDVEKVKNELRRQYGESAPASTAAPSSTTPLDHATADHTTAISAIPRGDSRFIAGHRVRHTADGKFQVERKGGFLTGAASDIGQHINASWAKQQGYPSHGAALARASAYAEPDPFTDPGAASRDAKLRSEVPEGAKAVSLDADTHGRIGTVRRDAETGKVHLAFDGGEETKGSNFEPLDAAHSWRAPESERKANLPKGGAAASLFGDEGEAPAAKSAESADASPIWKRERPRRERGQIGEISGLQASRTSGRQLDRLNNRADAAMGNVPDGLSGYAKEVINAHENGDVDENTPGIHPDASRAIRDHKQWKREQKQSANSADIGKWNQVSHSQLAPGMKVYTGMGETPHTVSKVNDKSVTLQRPDGSKFKVNPSELTRMSWSDRQKAQAAISAGNPIPSEIATKYPELVSKAGAVVAAPAFKPAAPATGELFNNEKDNLFSGADAGASEPAASANVPVPEPAQIAPQTSQPKSSGVADFGEAIPGARKHRAIPTGPRPPKAEPAAAPHLAWRRQYSARQDAKTRRYFLTHGDKIVYAGGRPADFATKDEAEASIPLHAIARTHSVQNNARSGEPDNYAIVRKIGDRKRPVVKDGFKTRDEAMRYMATSPEEVLNHKFPKWEDYSYLDSVDRSGPERRKGNVSTDDFQNAFGFRGGQFGNWQTNKDGQTSLNHAYDALHDLADLTGLSPKDVSLGGKLAIAFGARGTGGENSAKAHYEPNGSVINLTKMKGAGSLGHEWFHALDHEVAKMEHGDKTENLLTSSIPYSPKNKELVSAWKNLVHTMVAKNETSAVDPAKAEKASKRASEGISNAMEKIDYRLRGEQAHNKRFKPFTPEQQNEWDRLKAQITSGDYGPMKYIGDGMGAIQIHEPIEKMSKLFKQATGRSLVSKEPGSAGQQLHNAIRYKADADAKVADAQSGKTETKKSRSDYFSNSIDLDKTRTGDYYSKPEEMAARAFSSYIEDKAAERKQRSDYLSAKSDNKHFAHIGAKPYPESEERASINAAFDRLFDALRSHGYGKSS